MSAPKIYLDILKAYIYMAQNQYYQIISATANSSLTKSASTCTGVSSSKSGCKMTGAGARTSASASAISVGCMMVTKNLLQY